jgi:Tfp pilus assembly protein PilN
MHELDFLPVEYRQQQTRRQWFSKRIAVVVLFIGLMLLARGTQMYHGSQARKALAALGPQCEQAQRQSNQLSALQEQLQTAEARAELHTYLRHPWPRSRLLAAIIAPLPKEVIFQELRMTREGNPNPDGTDRRPGASAEEPAAAKVSPAGLDLKWLRDNCDRTRTVIRISGSSGTSAALYQYLGCLAKDDLFAKADLVSIDEGQGAGMHFNALIVVRPGYGQPGGPSDAKAGGGQ